MPLATGPSCSRTLVAVPVKEKMSPCENNKLWFTPECNGSGLDGQIEPNSRVFQVAVAIGRNMLSLSVYVVVGARLLSCTSTQIACSFQLLSNNFVGAIRKLCKISVLLLNQNEQSLDCHQAWLENHVLPGIVHIYPDSA
ncbi:hypothetical protein OPV22_015107 [Ensete ventricosum]|uniref:Uncharacterized protein n=1 Tax=Ensete ventricosum TaxID=4639 RepID=A0AAV8R7I1_ENSVE|nr:hypothetical protein OPV22_015107 [Ensete ventricosum]